MRNHQTSLPGSLQWLSKQHPATLAASILAECINIQELRLHFFEIPSRSLEVFAEDTPLWTSVVDAVERIDTRLAQLASQFGGRWDIHKTSLPTQAGKPTALDYYHDIQVAKVWNQRRSTRIALHDFLLGICEEVQVLHRVRANNDLALLRRRSVEVIESMSAEICASIPFHLRRINANGRKCSSEAQQVAGACALIWPLETIAKCRYIGEDHRLVARATLEEIGHAIGVRQATRKLSELSG
ncbi:MAG: hypothetical protein ALECFALPRED_006995 [Alectoria fallacina]|uniref:Uncharacterized protein n=1 Tax=Alectoria fallacina TaxID=1903189 RepID=A0A8H3G648_9LECA|nr:MAG: hypothetical protein ALECFALPRED_006995 [Alectoria fallacina]